MIIFYISCDPESNYQDCDSFIIDNLNVEIIGEINTGILGPGTCIDSYDAILTLLDEGNNTLELSIENVVTNQIYNLNYYYLCGKGSDTELDPDLIYVQFYKDPILNINDTTELVSKHIGGFTNREFYYIEFQLNDNSCNGDYNSFFRSLE